MKNMLYLIFSLFVMVPAATAQSPDFVDLMREGGKIYVVYLLLGVILTGIFIYLFLLERKVGRMEKRIKKNKNQ